jgi:hypothetical protein
VSLSLPSLLLEHQDEAGRGAARAAHLEQHLLRLQALVPHLLPRIELQLAQLLLAEGDAVRCTVSAIFLQEGGDTHHFVHAHRVAALILRPDFDCRCEAPGCVGERLDTWPLHVCTEARLSLAGALNVAERSR